MFHWIIWMILATSVSITLLTQRQTTTWVRLIKYIHLCSQNVSIFVLTSLKWQTTSIFLPWVPHEQYENAKNKKLKDELPRSVGAQNSTGEQWRTKSRENEETEPKQKQHTVVYVTGDGSKVWCCKDWYCIGTWNVRSMNQGKLEVVKQEMARVNVNVLGISELKWTGMGEFNSKWPLHLLPWARIS